MSVRKRWVAVAALLGFLSSAAFAGHTAANLYRITPDGNAEAVGEIAFADTEHGLLITPALHDLASRGAHGTHIHTNADCGAGRMGDRLMAGAAAGSHYDPQDAGHHAGPYGDGHLGDLPNLIVEEEGSASIPVLAPRLTVADLAGRAVMVHAEPDRYDDHSGHHHGKGGIRMYCGVIE